MKKNLNNYNCSQAVLYSALRRGWNTAITHLVALTAFTAEYDLTSIQDQLTAVTDAENMKTAEQLQTEVNKARIDFVSGKAAFFEAFQMLKLYINLVFKPPFREPNLVEAGSNYYRKAQSDNWDALSNLLKASGDYIVNHKSELTANNKMPATFPAVLLDRIKVVNDAYTQWGLVNGIKPTDVSEKIQINNALYAALIEMFNTGRQVFSKNNTIKKDFTFSHVCKSVVGSSGIAGLRGGITSSVTGASLQGVIITSADGKYTAVTNAKGRFHIKQVLAGTYKFDVQAAGYTPLGQSVTIKPGVTRSIRVSLMPIAVIKVA